MAFAARRKRFIDVYRGASSVAYAVAGGEKGFVWDEDTRELFTPEAWKERRMGVDEPLQISRHVVVHAYRQHEETGKLLYPSTP